MDDESAIRRADEAFFAALNEMFVGNLEPMKELWSHADDVIYLGPNAVFHVGWAAVLDDWERQAAMKLGGEIHATDSQVQIGQDMAATHHRAHGTNTDASGNRVSVAIRGTNIYRKEDGQWKLICHHADPLPFLEGK